MATLNQLSAKLTVFKSAYGSIAAINTGDITSTLTDAGNDVADAISGFTAAANDSVVTSIIEGATLAKDGIERVKGHVEADIATLKSNASEVKSIIDKIDDLIDKGASWKEKETITETDDKGRTISRTDYHDQAKIDEANAEIDYYNTKGEAQLDAMANAINGVAFGVTGNMVLGGSLEASTTYSDGYKFAFEDFTYEAQEYPDDTVVLDDPTTPAGTELTTGEKIGACVVGAVSGPLKLLEGVFDFGTMIVGGIASIFSREAADSIYDFAATDLVGSATTAIFGEKITNSNEYQVSQSVSKYITYQIGRCVCPPVGAIVVSAGMSGNAMEAVYNNTGRGDAAIGVGLGLGVVQNVLNVDHGGTLLSNFIQETGAYVVPEVVTRVNDNQAKSKKKSNSDDKKDNK